MIKINTNKNNSHTTLRCMTIEYYRINKDIFKCIDASSSALTPIKTLNKYLLYL